VKEQQLLDSAKIAFTKMQHSWWDFAKILHTIREGQVYKLAGHKSFRHYIQKEFPTIYESTAAKQIAVVSNWGQEIEENIQAGIPLPAYESCYRVIAFKDRCPAEKYLKFKEGVLSNRISAGKVYKEIQDFTNEQKEKIKAIMAKPVSSKTKDEDEELGLTGGYIYSIDEIQSRVGELKKSLVNFLDNREAYTMNTKIQTLGKSLDELYLIIDEVLSELEEME